MALGEKMVDMSSASPQTAISPTEEDSLGFCIPVHGWRPPVFVREWVSQLDFSKTNIKYCWVLFTAGDTLGEAASLFEQQLVQAGMEVDCMLSLLMPESYVGLPFMDVDPHDREQRKLSAAKQALMRYLPAIKSRQRGVRELHIGRWPRINSRLLGYAFEHWLLSDKPFRVAKDKCTGCGLCVRHCPADNMELDEEHRPLWKHSGRCLSCFACYHHCPVRAIEYGHRTKGKGQYYFERKQNLKI